MTQRRARRYVCVFVVLLTLLAITYGCASVDVAERDCGMAHVTWTTPVETQGEITVVWRTDAVAARSECNASAIYGCTKIHGGRADIWLVDETRAECAVMKLAHELRHGLGQRHE